MRARRGFTLLEVLAAVAVFGLVYVVIARAAIGGLGIEGDARRRLEASLLADGALAGLEESLLTGAGPPRMGPSEREEGPFVVRTRVEAVDPVALGLVLDAEAAREGRDLRTPTRPDRRPPADSVPSLFAPTGGAGAVPLLAFHVEVAWLEGASEQRVTRSTFVFDAAAAAPLLATLPAPGEGRADDDAPEGAFRGEPDA